MSKTTKTKKTKIETDFSFSNNRLNLVKDLINDPGYTPMKEKELAVLLQVTKEDRDELKAILNTLVERGEAECTSRGRYIKSDGGIIGQYTGNAKGFGFVTVEGRDEDIFIPEENTNGAFHLDTVQVELLPGVTGKRQEGRITKIITRGMTDIVGTYNDNRNFGFVVADNTKIAYDIFIPSGQSLGAVTGDKVVVTISDYGDIFFGKKPEGKVTEIIGNINDPGVDILSVVKGYDIPSEFSEKVMNQAARTPDEIIPQDLEGRLDLRNMQMVTIDGEEAKDLDDAVSLHIDNDLYYLGVHIADVSNYVQENSALDREALKRGTSVYLTDRVIPMLPHRLSNGICSLNHGEDRLALSCLMTINKMGDVIDHQIAETVINVDERMTYTSVAAILDDADPDECEKYKALVPMFEQMKELAAILHKKRSDKGSIDFDSNEAKIILDEQGDPIEIKPYERNTATDLIEDFMLMANQTVAQHFFWLQVPFLYRTHEQPSPEKIDALSVFIKNFGYFLKVKEGEVTPKEIQKLLSKIEGTKEEAVISRIALRSMMQAKYTTECTGHFGLAMDYYCHFTSPIRRYPDLQIHRIIKEQLRGKLTPERIKHYAEILPEVAKHSSETERRADDAERDTDKLKKAQFMENHVGEIFDGVISGVTAWGMFVELDNTCEGLIRAASMWDDYYAYDESSYSLVGESTGKTYTLGQKVKIKVDAADRLEKTIDFKLYSENEDDDAAKGAAFKRSRMRDNMAEDNERDGRGKRDDGTDSGFDAPKRRRSSEIDDSSFDKRDNMHPFDTRKTKPSKSKRTKGEKAYAKSGRAHSKDDKPYSKSGKSYSKDDKSYSKNGKNYSKDEKSCDKSRKVDYSKLDLKDIEPDSRTGEPRPKHTTGNSKFGKHYGASSGKKNSGASGNSDRYSSKKSDGGYGKTDRYSTKKSDGGYGKSDRYSSKKSDGGYGKSDRYSSKKSDGYRGKSEEGASSGKKYSVHKYKKSATSKGARMNQGKH